MGYFKYVYIKKLLCFFKAVGLVVKESNKISTIYEIWEIEGLHVDFPEIFNIEV